MSAPVIKEATDPDPGTSAKYGAPDIVQMARLLMGTHPTEIIQEYAIKNTAMTLGTGSQVVTGSKRFNNTVLQINNPATTFQYIINSSAITANRNITLPLLVSDDTFVFANFIQTLTNKTIVAGSNSISGISGTNMANPVTSANFATSCFIVDASDNTKKWGWTLSGATTAKTVTLISAHTDNRSISFPDATTMLAGLAVQQTFTAQQTISPVTTPALIANSASGPTGSGSEFIGGISIPAGTVAFATNPQTGDYITNKIAQATLTNPSAGTIPNAASLKITGAPIASTNVTITNPYALWVAAGATLLGGTLAVSEYATLTKGSRNTKSTLPYAASVAVDFDASEIQVVTLTGDITFATSNNRGDTRHKTIFIIGDGTERTLAFNASWKIANKPTSIPVNGQGVLTLTCIGANETDVKGAYALLE